MDQKETQVEKLLGNRPQLTRIQAEKIVGEIINQTEKDIIEGKSETRPKGLLNCMEGEKNDGNIG